MKMVYCVTSETLGFVFPAQVFDPPETVGVLARKESFFPLIQITLIVSSALSASLGTNPHVPVARAAKQPGFVSFLQHAIQPPPKKKSSIFC